MPYYIRMVQGAPFQIWEINEGVAYRLGVTNVEGGPDYYPAAPGEPALEILKQKVPSWFEQGNGFVKTIGCI